MTTALLPIENYVPHRGAMLWIHRLLELDEEHAVAEVTVPAEGLFVQDGGVPAWLGIEYMAQTIAAWAGGRARRAGGTPKVGFLLGTRRYTAHRAHYPAGSTLRVETRCELIGDNGLGLFACRIVLHGEEVAVAQVSVFEPPDGAAP
jgi:predicted hotdog family 3-hydroxylacyl-ACP dehydratase